MLFLSLNYFKGCFFLAMSFSVHRKSFCLAKKKKIFLHASPFGFCRDSVIISEFLRCWEADFCFSFRRSQTSVPVSCVCRLS